MENWGNKDWIGLTGVCVVGEFEKNVEVDGDCVECSCGTTESLKRLVNNDNVTNDVGSMWYVPWKRGQEIAITFDFGGFLYVSGEFSPAKKLLI